MSASWLMLERYALGELSPEEARALEALLAADEAARERLAAIRGDSRALPPLPDVRPANNARWFAGLGALAAAAVVAVVLGVPRSPGTPPNSRPWKGGTLAIELVRERAGEVVVAPSEVAPGDRMKVRLTCPPGEHAYSIVVFQGGERFEPLAPGTVECGNRVPLPGAWTTDDAATQLVACAVLDGAASERIEDLGEDSVCASVILSHHGRNPSP